MSNPPLRPAWAGRGALLAVLLALGACSPSQSPSNASTADTVQSADGQSLTLLSVSASPSRVVVRYSKQLDGLCAFLNDSNQNLLHSVNWFCQDGSDLTVTLSPSDLSRPLQVGETLLFCPGNQSSVPCSSAVVQEEKDLDLLRITTSPTRVTVRYSKHLGTLCAHLFDADQYLLHNVNWFCDEGPDVTLQLDPSQLTRTLQVGETVRFCPANQNSVPCDLAVVEAEADCTGVKTLGDSSTAYRAISPEATSLGITEWILSPPSVAKGTSLVYRAVGRDSEGLVVGYGTLVLVLDEVLAPGAVVDAAMAERMFQERSFFLASGTALSTETQKALWQGLSLDMPSDACMVPSAASVVGTPISQSPSALGSPISQPSAPQPSSSIFGRLLDMARSLSSEAPAPSTQTSTAALDTAPGPFATCRAQGEAAYRPTLLLLPQLYRALQSGNLASIASLAAEPMRLHAEYNCCSGANTPLPGKSGQPWTGCTCAERFEDEAPRLNIIEPPDMRDGFDIQYVCEACPSNQYFNEDDQRCRPNTILLRDDFARVSVGLPTQVNVMTNDTISPVGGTNMGTSASDPSVSATPDHPYIEVLASQPGTYEVRYFVTDNTTGESDGAILQVQASCPGDRPVFNAALGQCESCPDGDIFNSATGACEACQNPTPVTTITVTPSNCTTSGDTAVAFSTSVSAGYYLLKYESSAYNTYKGYSGYWTYDLKVKTPGQSAGSFTSGSSLASSEEVVAAMTGRAYTMPVYASGTAYFYAQPGSCLYNRGDMKAALLSCSNTAPTPPPPPDEPPPPPTCPSGQVVGEDNASCVCPPGSPGTLETGCACPSDGPPLDPDTQQCACPEGSTWNSQTGLCEKKLACFGAQGDGCTPLQRDRNLRYFLNKPACDAFWTGPAPQVAGVSTCVSDPHFAEMTVGLRPLQYQAVTPGSLRHDQCCKQHPGGFYCNGDNSEWGQCVREFNAAVLDALRDARSWRVQYDFGTQLAVNAFPDIFNPDGTLTSYGQQLRAPYGVRMSAEDAHLCESGTVVQSSSGLDICGTVSSPGPTNVEEPVAGDTPLPATEGICERFTAAVYGGSEYGSTEVAPAFFQGMQNYVNRPDLPSVGADALTSSAQLAYIQSALDELTRDATDGFLVSEEDYHQRPEANDVWVWRDNASTGGEIQAVAVLRARERTSITGVDDLRSLFATSPRHAKALSDCLMQKLNTRNNADEPSSTTLHGRVALTPASQGTQASGSLAFWQTRASDWNSRWQLAGLPNAATEDTTLEEYIFGERCGHYPTNPARLPYLGFGSRVTAFSYQPPTLPGKDVLLMRTYHAESFTERLDLLRQATAVGYPTADEFIVDPSDTCAMDRRYATNSNDGGRFRNVDGTPASSFEEALCSLDEAGESTALASINDIRTNALPNASIEDFQAHLDFDGRLLVTDPARVIPATNTMDYTLWRDATLDLLTEWENALLACP